MKSAKACILVLLLFCLTATVLSETRAADPSSHKADDATVGVSLVGDTPDETLALMSVHGFWGRGKIVEVQGQSFDKAYEARTVGKPGKPHGVQFQVKYQNTIEKGDGVVVCFYVRTTDVDSATIDVMAGPGSREKVGICREWALVQYAFTAKNSAAADDPENRLMAFIGQANQTLEFGGIKVTNFGQGFDIKSIDQKLPKPQVQLLRTGTEYTQPTPGAVTGALIDESVVKTTIHAGPNGSDEADGSVTHPVKTFRHALSLANEKLRQGQGVRILLAPGVYREGFVGATQREPFTVDGKALGEAGRDATLIIEAAKSGEVIFDGADLIPLSRWEKVGSTSEGGAIYRHDLPVDLGWDRKHFNAINPRKPIGYRMDTAFINDVPLRQVMLENYPDVDTKKGGAMYKEDAYLGPLDPRQTLVSGTFGVQVHDPEKRSIFICPPMGMDLTHAQIAVGTKGEAIRLSQKNNVVVRGITFQRYGANMGAAPLFFLGDGKNMSKNFLVENCSFLWNNGSGIRFANVEGMTLRGCRSNYNGFRGENGHALRNVLMENNQANFNNWRGVWGQFRGWAVAGSKTVHVRDMIVQDSEYIGNMAYGFWLDVDCQNINVDGILAAYNTNAGFYFEISDGPCLIEHAILAYNGTGLVFQGSDQIEARRNIIVGNGKQIRMTHEKEFGRPRSGKLLDSIYGTRTLPKGTSALGRVNIHDNLIVATNPNTQFIAIQFQKDFPERRAQFLRDWLKMNNNVYVDTTGEAMFGMNDLRDAYGRKLLSQRDAQLPLAQWQSQAKQDLNSKKIARDQLTWSGEIPHTDAFKAESAYLQRGISSEKKAEAEAFFRFVGLRLDSLTTQNIYEDEFQTE